jgi:hypothetical protein
MILSEASDKQWFRLPLSLMEIRDSGVERWEDSSSIENTRQFNHSYCQSPKGPRLNCAPARNCGRLPSQASLRRNARTPVKKRRPHLRNASHKPTFLTSAFHDYIPSPLIANTPWNLSTSRTTAPFGPLAKVRRLHGPKRRPQRNPRLTRSSTGSRTSSSG